jgi:hypothetical protein
MKLDLSRQIFEKYENIKSHENSSSRSRVVRCGRMDGRTDGQTDMAKLIVAFRNFANAPKSEPRLKQQPKKVQSRLGITLVKTPLVVLFDINTFSYKPLSSHRTIHSTVQNSDWT